MNTVLVVDDSRMLREMISEILRTSGLTVVQARDGVEAVAKIQARCPDLVITDFVMPRMNGYELCRRIRAYPKARRVPVVVCSTKSEDLSRRLGLRSGVDAYITKPFNPDELSSTVQRLLGRAGAAGHRPSTLLGSWRELEALDGD